MSLVRARVARLLVCALVGACGSGNNHDGSAAPPGSTAGGASPAPSGSDPSASSASGGDAPGTDGGVSPDVTSSPPPTPGNKPTLERLELVTAGASTASTDGNRPGNSWGGHQTRLVRTSGDQIYTAYLVTGTAFNTSQWQLVRRVGPGNWQKVASGTAGREPVNILRTPTDRLRVVAWPNHTPYVTGLVPENGGYTRHESDVPGSWEASDWPYNAAGIGSDGTTCIVQSASKLHPGAFNWACTDTKTSTWTYRTKELPYRHCYAYVIPNGSRLDVVASRDVQWSTLGYARPPGTTFDYVFNAVGAWNTPAIGTAPLSFLDVREELPSAQYPSPHADAQIDAYVDARGRTHVLYTLRGRSTAGVAKTRHAVLVGNAVVRDVEMPVTGYWRLIQDTAGRFYALYGSGADFSIYTSKNEDGTELDAPTTFDIGAERVLYSGLAIAAPRAGVPLADIVDGGFPSGNGGDRWVYFRIRLH